MKWIDTVALKRDYPVKEIVERYGIELRSGGVAHLGRCPFHDDGGRPNLHVYRGTQSWYCYRCGIGGDVISFVERMEGVRFRDAVARLTREQPAATKPMQRSVERTKVRARRRTVCGPDERACLAAAVELYHNRLLSDPAALDYVRGRGLDDGIIETCRLGYAAGNELVTYLRWRRIPVQAALRVGLLARGGREFMAGRVVVPEIRGGQPIWLVGRTIETQLDGPKYLGLPGRKPLLGWDTAKDSREVFLVEGVFDWLTLLNWGYPSLALVGTHVRLAALNALARFERISLVLDADKAGHAATENLARALGSRAVVVKLPGVKDVAELAPHWDGAKTFAHTLARSRVVRAA